MADFYLIGGDARQRYLAELLRDRGHRVRAFGVALDRQDLIPGEAILCLPVPSLRGDRIPGEGGSFLPCERAFEAMRDRHCVVHCSDQEEARIQSFGPKSVTNLAKDEAFTWDNAILTAEGAIRHVSGIFGLSLWGSRCLVLGFGRIARNLVPRLVALGAQVCVAARSDAARQKARSLGAQACDLNDLPSGADFIFNTIPARLEPDGLLAAARDGFFAELASPPYCLDPATAQKEGIHHEVLAGLPGKYYPKAAAQAILSGIFRGEFAQILL